VKKTLKFDKKKITLLINNKILRSLCITIPYKTLVNLEGSFLTGNIAELSCDIKFLIKFSVVAEIKKER